MAQASRRSFGLRYINQTFSLIYGSRPPRTNTELKECPLTLKENLVFARLVRLFFGRENGTGASSNAFNAQHNSSRSKIWSYFCSYFPVCKKKCVSHDMPPNYKSFKLARYRIHLQSFLKSFLRVTDNFPPFVFEVHPSF